MSSQLSFKLGCPEKVLSLFKKGSIVSFMNNSMEHDKEMVSSFIQIFFIEPLSKILVIKIRRQSRKFLKKKNVSSFKFNISGSNFYRYMIQNYIKMNNFLEVVFHLLSVKCLKDNRSLPKNFRPADLKQM